MKNFPPNRTFTNVSFEHGFSNSTVRGDTDRDRTMSAEKFDNISATIGSAGVLKGESGGVQYSEYYVITRFEKDTGNAVFRPSQQ